MTCATRFSYFFLVAVIVMAAATHLATPLITVLFSYFALRKLYFGKRKWLSLLLFFVVVSATLYGLGFLFRPGQPKSGHRRRCEKRIPVCWQFRASSYHATCLRFNRNCSCGQLVFESADREIFQAEEYEPVFSCNRRNQKPLRIIFPPF